MSRSKKIFLFPLTLLALLLAYSPLLADSHEGHQHHPKAPATHAAGQGPVFAAMPGPGKKVPIGSNGYLIYSFDKKPKIGTVIMKVELYTPEGKRDTSGEVLGDCGMPSMRGAHETGDQPFKLSQKGDYLLPLNVVMPGDWEIRLTIRKAGQAIFQGSHSFDI
jgi:hypothetical protein